MLPIVGISDICTMNGGGIALTWPLPRRSQQQPDLGEAENIGDDNFLKFQRGLSLC